MSSTLPYQLGDLARRHVREQYPPLDGPVKVCIHLAANLELISVTVEAVPGRGGPPARPARRPAEAWGPTPTQRAILTALDGVALRTAGLAEVLGGDRLALFRAGGIGELRDRGFVAHEPRIGYYRPDAPPPELRGRA
jgi:hypothetical protein